MSAALSMTLDRKVCLPFDLWTVTYIINNSLKDNDLGADWSHVINRWNEAKFLFIIISIGGTVNEIALSLEWPVSAQSNQSKALNYSERLLLIWIYSLLPIHTFKPVRIIFKKLQDIKHKL